VVPGNHDRVGDDAGRALMKGRRVAVEEHPGLYLVLVDSTAEHNRSYWACHGELTRRMLDEVDAALDAAPEHSLVAVLMHHHLVALPVESWLERMSERLRLPYSGELPLGRELLERVQGRCDLVLHGHRHVPREIHLFTDTRRPLALYNAGSSTELGRVRVFTHEGGQMRITPRWLWADPARAWGPRRVPVMVPAPMVTRERSVA